MPNPFPGRRRQYGRSGADPVDVRYGFPRRGAETRREVQPSSGSGKKLHVLEMAPMYKDTSLRGVAPHGERETGACRFPRHQRTI